MATKKIVAVSIVITIIITPLLWNLSSTSAVTVNSLKFDNPNNKESHTIEGVPYVSQETFLYCAYATPTMIFLFYSINTTLHEVLYYSGIGHSLIYLKSAGLSLQHRFIGSTLISQVPNERNFLATLYNLSYQNWYPEISKMTNDNCWQKYWTRVKQNISNDVPVITSVDPYSIPYLKEKLNPPNNQTHGGHAFVLVGFNETNGTVCYNDPAAGIWNDDVNGTYVYISKDIFKGAVQNTTGTKYYIETFMNNSDPPPYTLEQRFRMSHERNTQKMKGKLGAYSDLKLPLFPHLGIKALKTFRRDLRIGITRRMITVLIYSTDDEIINAFYNCSPIVIEKLNASQYLLKITDFLENETLSSICKHDASLLLKESNCWKNITKYISDLKEIRRNNSYLLTLILSIPVTAKMKKTLNEMISIEKEIIKWSTTCKFIKSV